MVSSQSVFERIIEYLNMLFKDVQNTYTKVFPKTTLLTPLTPSPNKVFSYSVQGYSELQKSKSYLIFMKF